jgi:tetratricopeptide (TPR) repeat protein
VATAFPAYDYSQPIVINTYNTPPADATAEASPDQSAAAQATQDSPETTAGYQLFDQSVSAFKSGDYRTALRLDEQAVRKVSNDPVLHEFGALCLFALGDYARAAAVLNSFLAVAPGMDWATLSSLYPDVETYTRQLRALETHTTQQPADTAARFVLAYHYLTAGHTENAIAELKVVVEKQPGDRVAKRILESLQPPEQPAQALPPPTPAEGPSTEAATAPSTDLVGKWRAERDGSIFELSIQEDGQFSWSAAESGRSPITVGGQMATTSDTLILESSQQGTMVARVTSKGPDQFQFVTLGGPPNDEGLTFSRVD